MAGLRDRSASCCWWANGVVGVAEKTVPSGLAALLVATVPLWLLGLDAGLNHARLGLAPLAGLLLGLAGVALLSGLGGGAGQVSVTGVLIILGAAGMWALGTIMARRGTIPVQPGAGQRDGAAGRRRGRCWCWPRRPGSSARCAWATCRPGPGSRSAT